MILSPNCAKCRSRMVEGFIADYTNGAILRPSDWVEGEPVKSFWTGTKISDKQQYKVKTFRCENCGYLESYAAKEK